MTRLGNHTNSGPVHSAHKEGGQIKALFESLSLSVRIVRVRASLNMAPGASVRARHVT